MTVRVYTVGKYAHISFPYDPVLVAVARGIPGRKWDKPTKTWKFPLSRKAIEHIQAYIPQAQIAADIQELIVAEEEKVYAARKTKAETKGVTADSIRDYEFKTRPYDHQAEAFLLSREAESFALLMEQGTGKTKVAIDTAAYLFSKAEINSLIVACPNSVKSNWAIDELSTHMPDWVDYRAAYWEASPTKAEAEQLASLSEKGSHLRVLVVNIEGLSTKRCKDYVLKFARMTTPMFVVDESSRIKSFGSKRSQATRHIAKLCPYRRIMTGTPVTQGPMDIFSQFYTLDSNILGFGSFYAFRNHYAVMGGYEMKEIVNYKNMEELHETIDPYSYRVLKDDCLDLPEKVYQKRYVEHTKEQARVYENMRKKMETDLKDGEIASAAIALVKIGKLQQINSNFVTNDEGEMSTVDEKENPRLAALVEVLEDHGGKAIIWARYRHDIELITKTLNHQFGPGCAASFYGDTSTEDRTKVRTDFQQGDHELQFFVGNPEAGGIGLTLTAADLVVYYANDFKLESRLQSEDRAHRIGQTKNVTYVDLITKGTVDEKIVGALRDKRGLASLVTKDNLTEWI